MKLHETLVTLQHDCWNLLYRAAVQRRHKLHTPAITTGSGSSFDTRTVVLRHTDVAKRQLTCYTDKRSAKMKDLEINPQIVWHFYDNGQQVQIKARGKAIVHHKNEWTKIIWQEIPPRNRKDYCALKPSGAVIEHPQDATPAVFLTGEPDAVHTEYGYDNFVVIDTIIEEIDWLHLHREGHQRARLVWNGEDWEKNWLVP